MDEGFVLAGKKLVVVGGAAGFSADTMLELLRDGLTIDELLKIIQQRLIGMAKPHPWKRMIQ